MDDKDTKGDIYEYTLGKIAAAGQNGQFRTPRHIIKMMVELMQPKRTDTICDPACGTKVKSLPMLNLPNAITMTRFLAMNLTAQCYALVR